MKFEIEEIIDTTIENYSKQIAIRIQDIQDKIPKQNKIDITDITKQIERFGNVQNIMKYFTLSEILFQHKKLYRKELSHLKKNIKQKLQNESISLNKAKQILNNKFLKLNLTYENITKLYDSIRNHSYFPNVIFCFDIDKKCGGTRTLGISSYTDKIVQAIIADILNLIYEPYFCKSSFGYRRNSNCHSLLRQLNNTAKYSDCNFILKADIEGYFDNINHSNLLQFLKLKCEDKYFLMYIRRFLQCKFIYNSEQFDNTEGTPQGGIISPVLSNIYLHYILDYWFISDIKFCYNSSEIFRYCDDFIVTANNKSVAENIQSKIADRLSIFGLKLKEKKSVIIPFDANKSFNLFSFNLRRNNDNSITFTTSYKSATSCKTKIDKVISSGIIPSATNIVVRVSEILRGWYGYYGVYTNFNWLYNIYLYTMECLYSTLCHNPSTAITTESDLDTLIVNVGNLYPPTSLISL